MNTVIIECEKCRTVNYYPPKQNFDLPQTIIDPIPGLGEPKITCDKECQGVFFLAPNIITSSIDLKLIGRLQEYLDKYPSESFNPVRVRCRYDAIRALEYFRLLQTPNQFLDHELIDFSQRLNAWLRKFDRVICYYQNWPLFNNERPTRAEVETILSDIDYLNHLAPIFRASRTGQ